MTGTQITDLPDEILLHVLSFLEPTDIPTVQRLARRFLKVGRDGHFWRQRCFDSSSFLHNLDRRRRLRRAFAGASGGGSTADRDADAAADAEEPPAQRRVRFMASWDPHYKSENVSWYDEYIQRNAPITVSWLQQPHAAAAGDGGSTPSSEGGTPVEARGVALYRPDNPCSGDTRGPETVLAVSPLDDGSVCLWDVTGAGGRRKGAIRARSRPGILFIGGPGADNSSRSKRIDSGVTECVAVDSQLHRAFFAVQNHLIEVDLRRLCAVECESYPWSITALSAAHPTLPLVVGTSLGIHQHDYRARPQQPPDDGPGRVDGFGGGLTARDLYERSIRALFSDKPLPPYASLSQPGPLSILQVRRPGAAGADAADEVCVAGRFPSILLYDLRRFPSIRGTIHSGARLSSLTSLPYPFSDAACKLRRDGALSAAQAEASRPDPAAGQTLVACGEYNTKGSLEMYPLLPSSSSSSSSSSSAPPSTSSPHGPPAAAAPLQNRQTSSDSKLLSVASHGTRLVFSDGSGRLKWFERDGTTEVRRARIGHCEAEAARGPSLFASMPGSDDMARKLLPTRRGGGGGDPGQAANGDDLLFWTGERLGLVGFSAGPGFTAESFAERARSEEELRRKAEERAYGDDMRRALERQADEVRFVRNLGLRT